MTPTAVAHDCAWCALDAVTKGRLEPVVISGLALCCQDLQFRERELAKRSPLASDARVIRRQMTAIREHQRDLLEGRPTEPAVDLWSK